MHTTPIRLVCCLCALVLVLAGCSPAQPAATPPSTQAAPTPIAAQATPDRWELVWSDEFDGPTLDPANWTPEIGAGGWGNNELQYYTDRPENLRIEDGMLVIEARQEDYRSSTYTSARIKTQGKRTFRYGRIEARMRLPVGGKGIWPAFWMLGEDFTTVGWPRCGEIDIMENIGQPNTVYGTVHGPGYSGGNGIGSAYTVPGPPLSADFHVYAVEWEPGEIRWYVDDAQFHTVRAEQVPGEWVFDHPFFLLLNLAVGGNWPGYPDETTPFPQQLVVDYVRVYRDTTLVLPAPQTLRIADIRLELTQADEGLQAEAWVTVVDQDGNPVEGATVTGGWLGVTVGATEQATTDAQGMAGPFRGRVVPSAREVSFCVTRVRKPGATYDKSQNAVTCVFATP